MLVNIVSQSGSRASASGSTVLGPNGVSILRARHREQTRAYRFFYNIDFDYHRNIGRRHRKLKHKYAETMNRKLSWDQPSLSEDPRATFRRMAGWYGFPVWSRCGVYSRFFNTDSFEGGKKRREAEKSRESNPDNGKADTSSNSAFWNEYDSWRSQLHDVVNLWSKQASPGAKRANSSPSSSQSTPTAKTEVQEDAKSTTTSAEEEYVCDPISNRKVSKTTYGSHTDGPEIPVQTFRSCRSQFNAVSPSEIDEEVIRHPVHSNGLPPPAELDKYNDVKIDELPTETDHVMYQEDAGPQDQAMYSDEYELNHLPQEEFAEVYDDLHKYTPFKQDDMGSEVEGQIQKYDDLDKYKLYRPYMHNEDPVIDEPPSQKYEDLDQYRPRTFEDNVEIDNSIPVYEDLNRYSTPEFSEPMSSQESEPFQQYGDLDRYKAFRYQGPGNKTILEKDIVDECLNLLDLKNETHEALEQESEKHITALDAANKEAAANVQLSQKKAQGIQKPNMTGHFVRDFPEEFATKWEINADSSAGELQPKNETDTWVYETSSKDSDAAYENEVKMRVQSEEKKHFDNLTESAAFNELESTLGRQSTLEPALNRTRSSLSHREREEAEVDPYATDPRGLETSYVEECAIDPIGPIFVKTYGNLESKDSQECTPATEPETWTFKNAIAEELAASTGAVKLNDPSPDTEPTVYKILAYDPTMQSINIAETTSVVPDQAAPLTPAEVLLRLSNPTKFFTHFAPLQKEGFEIVSGSGDVLVFRKVRPAAPPTTPSVNPIDMMGKPPPFPNAAAFASPTGFINYDIPPVEETQEPPFRSNIDVRREEPVFSGPKISTEEGGRRKKRSITKRFLIGGAWVAGISYAAGVILEYFHTGGIDGKGPTGF